MPKLFNPDLTAHYDLPRIDSWPESKHKFDDDSRWAVEAALASGRPLLLRGEPGIGKSQLARAVAEVQDVPFLYHVVDERSERDDLLYTYDAVSRLAQAQMTALAKPESDSSWEDRMAEDRFIRPGVLWWAFNWGSAQEQASRYFRPCPEPQKPEGWRHVKEDGKTAVCGPVVLIDEIDKADPSVPNGLLESLGNNGFQTAQLGRAVELANGGGPPLVIITTNEERELPTAFLRRCLVLHMHFPPRDKTVEAFLLERARVFWSKEDIRDAVCKQVINALEDDREAAVRLGLGKPGAAEFLDIIKVLVTLHPGDSEAQRIALDRVRDFALKKNSQDGLV